MQPDLVDLLARRLIFGSIANIAQRLLEAADAFAQPLAELRQLLGAEQKQADHENHQEVDRLE